MNLWHALALDMARAPQAFESLVQRYEEKHRFYHGMSHIESSLQEYWARGWRIASWPVLVEFALWYHDAIYDPRRADNEELSAALAEEVFCAAGGARVLGRRLHAYILATKHTGLPSDPDEAVLVDVDLAILGQAEDVFDDYERRIWYEYQPVYTLEEFRAGRPLFLRRHFLENRPTIYGTRPFRDAYEAAAQANLRRSIAGLTLPA